MDVKAAFPHGRYVAPEGSSMIAPGIDPDGPEPVFRQLAGILAARIGLGDPPPGRSIPSESRLCQEFGVSRGTARKAVAVLREQGLVVTVVGRGTYVTPR